MQQKMKYDVDRNTVVSALAEKNGKLNGKK